MKKLRLLPLLAAAALIWGGCGVSPAPETDTAASSVPETTAEPTVAVSSVEVTETAHSPLYIPDVPVEDIIRYFNEVVLQAEYTDGTGDAALVQKWTEPIFYTIYGAPTAEDQAVLEDFFAQLNAIPGFPGIRPAATPPQENMSLSFLEPEVFTASFSQVVQGEDSLGAVQYWYYTDSNVLHTARIGYRTDIDQLQRNSILPEEIVNALGITDTVLRDDSITYQYSDENTTLSAVDTVILTLLYDPGIQCGMDSETCRQVIESLYY